MLLVVLFLPKAKIGNAKSNDNNTKDEKSRGLIYFGMFISQVVFYIFITNFSVIAKESGLIPASQTGVMMSVQAVGAFILSMNFGRYNKLIGDKIKYIGALAFAISYILLAYANNYGILIIGLLLNGIALGTLVPYFNTIALKGLNKEETPDIMSVMSACQYLGQFASPLILSAIMMMIGSNGLKMPYIIGTALCVALALLLIKTKAIEK
jgi:sugar phosphate permease